jgi:hypothetical protein
LDQGEQQRVDALLDTPLNWEVIVSRCWWHRIRPLTYQHLIALGKGRVPMSVFAELIVYVEELTQRAHRLSRSLSEVAEYFEESGLRGLVFKGPPLAQDAYGDVTLRECGDLDLLVPQDEFPKVADMLLSKGFKSWWDREGQKRQVFACEFEREDATLDVHWSLAPDWLNYQVDFQPYWSGGIGLLASGTGLRKPCPEDALSILAIHGTKHFWERLRWISDIAELIKRGHIRDWDRVLKTAERTRCTRSVLLALWLSRNLLAAELPPGIQTKLQQNKKIERLGDQVCRWLSHGERTKEARNLRDRFGFRMGVCERMRDRVPQVLHYLIGRAAGQAE